MVINANIFSYKNEEKIDQMIKFCKNKKIDVAITSEKNCKWTTRTKDTMSHKIKVLGTETRCHYACIKACETTNAEWFQGELMNAMTGRTSSFIQCQQVKLMT